MEKSMAIKRTGSGGGGSRKGLRVNQAATGRRERRKRFESGLGGGIT
jgi:hypothetical protein